MLYVGLPRISTTIRKRRLGFSSDFWRSENEVAIDLVLWELKHGKNIGGQAHTFVDLLEADIGVLRDCLPAVMDDRAGRRKRAMGRGGGRESAEVDLVAVVVA